AERTPPRSCRMQSAPRSVRRALQAPRESPRVALHEGARNARRMPAKFAAAGGRFVGPARGPTARSLCRGSVARVERGDVALDECPHETAVLRLRHFPLNTACQPDVERLTDFVTV